MRSSTENTDLSLPKDVLIDLLANSIYNSKINYFLDIYDFKNKKEFSFAIHSKIA